VTTVHVALKLVRIGIDAQGEPFAVLQANEPGGSEVALNPGDFVWLTLIVETRKRPSNADGPVLNS
jgi:hypothetical protein